MTSSTVVDAAPQTEPQLPWSVFRVVPVRAERISPHLVRVSFAADSRADPRSGGARGATRGDADALRHFADNGYDQRIKLILPPAGGDLSELSDGADWYRRLRELPDERRPAVRTYTVRAVRSGPDGTEVDVDMVLHGVLGPASAWASAVVDAAVNTAAAERPRFSAALLGPDARHPGPHGGLEFVTEVIDDLLVVADETALPAVASILERLPAQTTGTVLIEVPDPGDVLSLVAPEGMRIRWLPRGSAANGDLMTAAALDWRPGSLAAGDSGTARSAGEVADPENWEELMWEVPEPVAAPGAGIRAWVAGEASAVRTIRRHLVGPCGLARKEVAFMGYWRLGRAEN